MSNTKDVKIQFEPQREEAERDVKALIVDYCEKAGIFHRVRHVGSMIVHGRRVRSNATYQADLWGILRGSGRHWECEVKKPHAKTDPKRQQGQSEWLDECARMGALAFRASSLEEFIQVITAKGL